MKRAVELTKANNAAMGKYDDFVDSMSTTGPSGTNSASAPVPSSNAKSTEDPDKN